MAVKVNSIYYPVYIHKGNTQSSILEMKYSSIFVLDNEKLHNIMGDKSCSGKLKVSGAQIENLIGNALPLSKIKIEEIQSPFVICTLVTDSCTLKCRYCYALNSGKSTIDMNSILQRLNEDKDYMILTITGGEPFLWHELADFVRNLETDMRAVIIDTNGTLLGCDNVITDNEIEILKEKEIVLRVSLDSDKEEINNRLRGQGDKVKNAVKRLCEAKADIWINTVVSTNNIGCLDSLAEYLISNGIIHWTLFKLTGREQNESFGCSNESVLKKAEDLNIKYGDMLNIYYFPHKKDAYSLFMIDTQGIYSTPDSDGKNRVPLGTIKSDSIKDIWSRFNREGNLHRYILNKDEV